MPSHRTVRSLLLPAAALTLVACSSGTDAATEPAALTDAHASHASHAMTFEGTQLTATQLHWLAQLRQLSTRFRDPAAARADGRTNVLPCQVDESPAKAGGMGIHYADLTRAFTVMAPDPLRPEALMYEPQKNGTLKLVGMEFIRTDAQPKPNIHGLEFHHHPTLPIWVLHVWIPEHNPTNIFADWNPRVGCGAV